MCKRNFLLCSIAVFAAIFIVFGQSLNYGFVDYDDPAYVTENSFVNQGLSPTGVKWAFSQELGDRGLKYHGVSNLWHPLTWLSHMLDVSVFGLEGAWGHHLVNLTLHGISAILLLLIAGRMTESWKVGLAVALLWAIHPLKVESAVWISERKDVLSGAFFWGAIACALKNQQGGRSYWNLSGWGLFICALLSKPSVVILPGLLILLSGISEKNQKWNWSFWLSGIQRYKWWFVSSVVIAILTVKLQTGGSHAYSVDNSSLEKRMLPQAIAMGYYILRFIVPWNLTIDYPLPNCPHLVYLGSWVVLFFGLVFTWRFRTRFPLFFFASGWWCLCLLPVSGLVYVGASFTSDRYLYLAIAGPLLAFAIFLKMHLKNASLFILTALVASGWGFLSWRQTKVWESSWTLFEHATQAQPKSALGWTNLGTLHEGEEQLEIARRHYKKALQISPADYITWHNFAIIEQKLGNIDGAKKGYQNAIESFPSCQPSLKNLGIILRDEKQYGAAEYHFRRAFEASNSRDGSSLWLLIEMCLAQKKFEVAKNYLVQLEKFPEGRRAHLSKEIRAARQFLETIR